MIFDSKIPDGPIENKWDLHRSNLKLINPANKRKFHIAVVGTGLAGGSAAASLAELGYNVKFSSDSRLDLTITPAFYHTLNEVLKSWKTDFYGSPQTFPTRRSISFLRTPYAIRNLTGQDMSYWLDDLQPISLKAGEETPLTFAKPA